MDDQHFDANDFICRHLVEPATVQETGMFGKFDSLRAALEHGQSKGVADATLTVYARQGRYLSRTTT